MGYGKMNSIKVSLICTLKNEESSVKEFLDSLLSQSRQPDEIIIVDGGSTDRTVEIINSYIENGAPIKLIVKEGPNIAEGRNIAIKNAKYDVIASTDAGCRIDKHWLENLIKPFEKDPSVDVVSGWYKPNARTEFEKCVAELTYPKLEQVLKDPDKFLPSSRSVAYKKTVWEKVGGYPEWLYTAEDTLFDLNLKRAGCKFVFAPDAVVYWRPRSTYRELRKQFYGYARGNSEAKIGIFTKHYLQLLLKKYVPGLLLLILGFWHWLFWVVLGGALLYSALRITTKHHQYPLTALGITFVTEIAEIFGWIRGIWR